MQIVFVPQISETHLSNNSVRLTIRTIYSTFGYNNILVIIVNPTICTVCTWIIALRLIVLKMSLSLLSFL